MKDLVRNIKTFITFDAPLQSANISTQFVNTHVRLQTDTPGWSTTATRQKLISSYWFTYVPGHFALLLVIATLVAIFVNGIFEQQHLFSILIAVLISFSTLYLFHYRPNFSGVFLPRLETIKESFERKQLEQLEKCRQAQLSNFSLALFFYVLASTNKMNPLKCDDYSAGLLTNLYGVDPGSMKKSLELILGTSKRKGLTDRKNTEIRNRFNETYTFLEELNFAKGIEKLQELEAKFFR